MKTCRRTGRTLAALSAAGLTVIGLSGCSIRNPFSSDSTTSPPAASQPAAVQPPAGQAAPGQAAPGQAATGQAPTGQAPQWQPPQNPGGGYWPAEVIASQAPSLGQIVVDGQGYTMYRFDQDSSYPSKSTCTGSCAYKWPPVLTKNAIRYYGIDQARLGAVERPDGTYQVTIGGWPVYHFSGDYRPGQTNGQGVGGTWFAVSPTGSKAGNAG